MKKSNIDDINRKRGIEMEENKVIVATYNRSAEKDSVMIEERNKLLKRHCDKKGYKIFKSYIDNGYSGINLNRPAFQEMLEDMKKGAFTKLVVTEMDRLNRTAIGFYELLKEFEKYNCDVECIRDGIDTSEPSGELFTSLIKYFAEFGEELKKEKK